MREFEWVTLSLPSVHHGTEQKQEQILTFLPIAIPSFFLASITAADTSSVLGDDGGSGFSSTGGASIVLCSAAWWGIYIGFASSAESEHFVSPSNFCVGLSHTWCWWD